MPILLLKIIEIFSIQRKMYNVHINMIELDTLTKNNNPKDEMKKIGGHQLSTYEKIENLKKEREKLRQEFTMQPIIRLYQTAHSTKQFTPISSEGLTIEERRADKHHTLQRIKDFKNKILESGKFVNKRNAEYNKLLKEDLNLKSTLKIKLPGDYTLEITLGRTHIIYKKKVSK